MEAPDGRTMDVPGEFELERLAICSVAGDYPGEREARSRWIDTEHLLLGLIREGDGVAAKALESLGISLDAVRQQVEEIIGQGQQAASGHIPFTPRGCASR
jgi:ATP-dependent Clp protease ATP-binding subunit ClpA